MREGIQLISRRGRRASGKPGFSLLEILVVLVVLLIGIMAVLRLFPGGFLTIQRTSEATSAQALIAQMMEQQKNLDSPADSVISVQFNSLGEPFFQRDVMPDDLRTLRTAEVPPGTHPYFASDCNRINWIIGETFRLPVPTPNPATGSYGSVHIIANGPVRNLLKSDQLNGPNDTINVYGMPMERTEQSFVPSIDRPDTTPILLNENQYAIDYARRKIAFYPRASVSTRPAPLNVRVFQIRFEYYANGPNNTIRRLPMLTGTINVPDVPAPTNGEVLRPVWQAIFLGDPDLPGDTKGTIQPPGLNLQYGIARDTDDVSRAFRLITEIPAATSRRAPRWSEDPYEYVWHSSQMGANGEIPANPGVLLFNPLGFNAPVQTSRGVQPFQVRLDYAPFDNHIIREERAVPNQAPYQVRLSLPFIHRSGDILEVPNNQGIEEPTEYKGMFFWWTDITDPNTMVQSPDLLVYDTSNGQEVARLENDIVTPGPGLTAPPANTPAFSTNAKAGTIRFDNQFIQSNNLRSANLRILYRAQKSWGMQIQKANSRYVLATQPDLINMTYRSYYVGNPAVWGEGTRIYFPVSEAGKTVVLGEYYVTTNDPANPMRRFNGEAYRINDNASLFLTASVNNGVRLTWIDLKSLHPEAAAQNWQFTSAPTGIAVSHVQGVSMKTRVIWKDSGRWRRRDDDTILVQPSRR